MTVMDTTNPTARLGARLPAEVHTLLKRAAARDAARRTIEENEILRVTLEDQRRIAQSIFDPPAPTPALRRAFRRRRALFGEA
jgi:uncharacterized protein (DUF1778 family)